MRLSNVGQAGGAQEAIDRGLRRADLRPLLLLAHVARARRDAADIERQAPRRPIFLAAFICQAGFDQPVGDHLAQVARRLALHAGRNLFAAKFEQQIRHQCCSARMLSSQLRVLAPAALRSRGRAGISSMRSSSNRSGISAVPPAAWDATVPIAGEAGAARVGLQERLAAGLGQIAHPQDVALPLGHRDDAARVEQVEHVAGLDRLVVGRQHHLCSGLLALAAGAPASSSALHSASASSKCRSSIRGIGEFEIVPGIFLLGLQEHVAVGHLLVALAAVEVQVVDVVDALHIHGEALQPIGQLAGNRRAFDAADLLKIGELRHFHAVAPAFPAEPPGAERRAFPIVLDEADVVQQRIDADRRQRAEIEFLQVGRVRLQDHLVLVVMLQPVRIFAIAAVLRPPRRLHVGGVPAQRPERPQRCRRVERSGADFHVVRLQDQAAIVRPVVVQRQDQPLEGAGRLHMRRQAAVTANPQVADAAAPSRRWRGASSARRPAPARQFEAGSFSSWPGMMRPGSPRSSGLRLSISQVAGAVAELVDGDRPQRLPRLHRIGGRHDRRGRGRLAAAGSAGTIISLFFSTGGASGSRPAARHDTSAGRRPSCRRAAASPRRASSGRSPERPCPASCRVHAPTGTSLRAGGRRASRRRRDGR